MNNNESIKYLMQLIQKVVKEQNNENNQITSAIIEGVNPDGSVNVNIPPDNNHFTNIPNQSPYPLFVGDTVKLLKEKGKASNMWVIAKCRSQSPIDIYYPVGSYYWNSQNINPGQLFGGIWEVINDKLTLESGGVLPAYCWHRIK